MSNKRYLVSIDKNMAKLNCVGESNIFISQHRDRKDDLASVIVRINAKDKDEGYLKLRRLLKALKYRLEEDSDFVFDFDLYRREKE